VLNRSLDQPTHGRVLVNRRAGSAERDVDGGAVNACHQTSTYKKLVTRSVK
jgi:hypothetical protein